MPLRNYDGLSSCSDEELKDELRKRKLGEIPQLLVFTDESIPFKKLQAEAETYIKDIVSGDCLHEDCDCKHYMFEKLITTFYGHSVWDWINNHSDM